MDSTLRSDAGIKGGDALKGLPRPKLFDLIQLLLSGGADMDVRDFKNCVIESIADEAVNALHGAVDVGGVEAM